MNEENYCYHDVKGDAVEGLVHCKVDMMQYLC